MFALYMYHILVLVIAKHNADEPPKKSTTQYETHQLHLIR